MIGWHDVVGTLGVCCFVLAYFQLQRAHWQPHSLIYLTANLAGAILVMISLTVEWNFSAFMLEVVWALISIYGIVKTLKNRKAKS